MCIRDSVVCHPGRYASLRPAFCWPRGTHAGAGSTRRLCSAGVADAETHDIADDEGAADHQQDNQHHRRQIDTAKVRQQPANGRQRRFRDAIDEHADGAGDIVVRVQYIERNKPAHDRRCDQAEDVEIDHEVDQLCNGGHADGPCILVRA
eukprot:TRINITY_DN8790_c0_g1_i1.p2 TRINITY_DN8790_c0_g1~~TRINITY_DN8790_c0_g1_i1.p2  ORF type:complete len:150 (+),score=26.54 TRINITY_DN8790_c0_g1_i1:159-608(+)